MRKFFPLVFFLALSLTPLLHASEVHAFSASLTPARKTFVIQPGNVIEYDLKLTNTSNEEQTVGTALSLFYYSDKGLFNIMPIEELSRNANTVHNWVDVPEAVTIPPGEVGIFPVSIAVPVDAPAGDHLGVIYLEARSDASANGMIGVKSRLASLVIVKVDGGTPQMKTGEVDNFEVSTRENARNTATVSFRFKNTSNEFFRLLSRVSIYESLDDLDTGDPLKVINSNKEVFPSANTIVDIQVGDLGDDYGEKEYFAYVEIYTKEGEEEKRLAEFKKEFYYYIPYSTDVGFGEPGQQQVIQKEVMVKPPVVDFVKELVIYIGGFLIILLVLIRLLFFGKKND